MRNKASDTCGEGPRASQVFQDELDRFGAVENSFIGLLVMQDDVYGIEIAGHRVTRQDFSGQSTLQGSEAEDVTLVSLQDELNQPVAKAADAVVEDNRFGRVGHGCGFIVAHDGGLGVQSEKESMGRGANAFARKRVKSADESFLCRMKTRIPL